VEVESVAARIPAPVHVVMPYCDRDTGEIGERCHGLRNGGDVDLAALVFVTIDFAAAESSKRDS
jgi:hypothetical protein